MAGSGEQRDANGLLVLAQDECWRRLAATPVGRLAFVAHGEACIRLVNHVVDGEEVHLVTRPGAKLDATLARPGTPVSLQVDEVDAESHTGWSVIARGHLHPVMDEVEQTRLDRAGIPAWIDMFRSRRWLRLDVVDVSGRVLDAPPA